MMAMDRVKNFLECSVCLEQYEDPKLLSCGHHFCRECIEDLVVWDEEDVAGLISCPLRCDAKTTITKDQTVSDLVPSYDFKNIVQTLQEDSSKAQASARRCQKDEECKGEVSVSCCGIMMCHECHRKHAKGKGHRASQKHRKNIPVGFSRRHNNFQIWCTKHNTSCSHICSDDAFLCPYCVRRNEDHKGHVKKTIDAEVTLLREAMLDEVQKIERVVAFFDATLTYCLMEQERVSKLVQELIDLKLILNDISHSHSLRIDIEKVSAMLTQSCLCAVREHQQQYGKISEFPSNYYKAHLKRCDAAVILEKGMILRRICDNPVPAILKAQVLCFSLLSSSDDMIHMNWGTKLSRQISLDDQVVSTLTYDVKGITEEIQKTNIRVSNSFEDLQEQRMIPTSDGGAARSILQSVRTSNGSINVKDNEKKSDRAGKYCECCGSHLPVEDSSVMQHYTMSKKAIHENEMHNGGYQSVSSKGIIENIRRLWQPMVLWQWLPQWAKQWGKRGMVLLLLSLVAQADPAFAMPLCAALLVSLIILLWIYVVMFL